MNERNNEKLVYLDPALAFEDAQRKDISGLVSHIGNDFLILKTKDPEMALWLGTKIRVFKDGKFELEGSYKELPHATLQFNLQEKSIPLLTDLLGRIRKDQHIEICSDKDVENSMRDNGFADLFLVPKALCDADYKQIDTATTFLGERFSLPLIITGMTGGVEKGASINHNLAKAAQKYKIPMGVGSQRIALENPKLAEIFRIKNETPDVFLLANIGFAQFRSPDALSLGEKAMQMIDANAIAIHLNAAQELVQVEGDRSFKGVLKNIEKLCTKFQGQVLIKEVGCGIDEDSAKALINAGVAAIDCGGSGGTSWTHIEGLRSSSPLVQRLGLCFRDWGLPTAFALHKLRKAFPEFPLVATGGIRDGLTVAKAIALGANMVGIGLPLFRAALRSGEAVQEEIHALGEELRIAMLGSGAYKLSELKNRLVIKKDYLKFDL